MPNVDYFELNNISIEEVRNLLNEKQSVEAVAKHFKVSARTVTRFINGQLERRFCWFPIVTINAKPANPPTTGE